MVGIVDQFHRKRSRLAPHSITEYRPREANVIADHLAGEGSSYLMQLFVNVADLPPTPLLNIDPEKQMSLRITLQVKGAPTSCNY